MITMIKTAILSLFLLQSTCHAITIISKDSSFTTNKVVRLQGYISPSSALSLVRDINNIKDMPGDLVILINSGGGEIFAGETMINAIKEEKRSSNIKIICVASESAHSMAFNILTACDIRYMTPNTVSLVHKAAVAALAKRGTAKNLREEANMLDLLDEPYRVSNAKAMSLTIENYDYYADRETYWSAKTLLKIKYLHDIVKIGR